MTARLAPRTTLLCSAAAVSAAALTAAVVARDVRPAVELGNGQVALDTAAASIGLFLAYLLYGRFRQSRLVSDAVLSVALLVLGGGNALLAVLPSLIGSPPQRLTGASAVSGLVAGALFVTAVWMPDRHASRAWRDRAPALIVAATGLLLVLAWLTSMLGSRIAFGSVDSFGGTGDGPVTTAQFIAAAAFLAASVGLCRNRARADRMATALAVAGVYGAGSRVAFAVAADPAATWVTAGTLLRIPFYGALVVAVALEVQAYWRRVAEAAVLEERRRMARDLHDGMAQELAFAATQARALADRSEHPTRARLIAAATERALDESRRAIAALTRPIDEPLAVSLAQCAEEVCERFDAKLQLDVDDDVSASPEVREALLRIVREAVSNAARHGGAHAVRVVLADAEGTRLRVEDDGQGFDVADLRHLSGRFGLVSMRERAEAVGGTFSVTSREPAGTTVEVVLP